MELAHGALTCGRLSRREELMPFWFYTDSPQVIDISKGSAINTMILWPGRVQFDLAGNTFLNNGHHHFLSAWFQTDGKG